MDYKNKSTLDLARHMRITGKYQTGSFFITGTGTNIGKTWLSCALLQFWRDAGLAVQAYKPVLSGFDPATPAASDAGRLLAIMGRTIDTVALDAIAPWRFNSPLSPNMAAMREGRCIDFDSLVGFTHCCLPVKRNSRQAEHASASALFALYPPPAASGDFYMTLIEGVGGVMVPLDETHTVRDWIAASGLPCILVAGSYLGSLSHTLTALESLQKVGVSVTAIVINETPESPVSLADVIATLRDHAGGVPLVAITRAEPQTGIAKLAALLG